MPKVIKAMCTGCKNKLSIYVHRSFNNTNLLLDVKHGVDYLIKDRVLSLGDKDKHGNSINTVVPACDQHSIIKDPWDTVEADLDDKFEDPFHTPDIG